MGLGRTKTEGKTCSTDDLLCEQKLRDVNEVVNENDQHGYP